MSRFVNVPVGVILVLGVLTIASQGQDAGPRALVEEQVVEVFSFKHADAEEMQRIAGDLFDLDSRQAAYARAHGLSGVIRMSSDPRTNALIIMGPQDDLSVIEALLIKLDTPTPEGERVPERTAKQLRERMARLERTVAGLRTSLTRARASQPDQSRSERVPASPSPASPATKARGTLVRIEATSVKGDPLELASIVSVGKRVKRGDLLIRIDSTTLGSAVQTQQIVIEQSQAELKQLETVVANTKLLKVTQLADAVLQVERANTALVEFQGGTQPLQVKVLQKEIQQAQRILKEQQDRVSAGLADGNSLSASKVDLDVAQTKLQVFEKYTGPKR